MRKHNLTYSGESLSGELFMTDNNGHIFWRRNKL